MSFDPFGYDPNKPPSEGVQPTPSEPMPPASAPPVDGTAPIPYQGPMQPMGDMSRSRERVMLPAIFLIILGVLNLLWVLLLAWVGLVMLYNSEQMERQIRDQAKDTPEGRKQLAQLDADLARTNSTLAEWLVFFGRWSVSCGGVSFLTSVFVILGGVQMLRMRGYGWGIFASLLTTVPVVTACCCVGQLVGIWALVVLLSSDVRMAFK